MNDEGRLLKIYRDGRRFERLQTIRLPKGAKGNIATLEVMAQIIREDSQEQDLKNLVMRDIIGLEKKTLSEQVSAAYEFCKNKIIYEQEKDGFETVADLWSCLYALNPLHPVGDCAIKTVAMGTCLSFIGLKTKLVAIGQIEGVEYYNHVFPTAAIDGKETTLDATFLDFQMGQELASLRRFEMEVFQ